MVGGAIILVLLVAFFFAKNAYANTLVAKRVPPNKANTAGWWLFIGLAGIAIGVVLAAVSSSRFMTPFVLGPLGGRWFARFDFGHCHRAQISLFIRHLTVYAYDRY